MAEETRAVFSALDDARTQLYHFKAVVIAGMGFFTDAYDLFCITAVSKLIGRLYFADLASANPGKLPPLENSAVSGVALFGTLAGQLFFGWLGDKLGRKQVYGITLITMVGCAIASGLSMGSTSSSVIKTLCFFRFWLGFGIGGDYPLSAVIMSEYSNQKTRGAFIAAVFAMQGMGILFAGLVSMLVSGAFLLAYHAPPYYKDTALSTPPEADFIWRLVLMCGAVPAALTFYWRMKMPETARYTALVEGNHKKAAADMARVLETEFYSSTSFEQQRRRRQHQHDEEHHNNKEIRSYSLWSTEFVKRHGIHLLGTTSTWFLLDIAFYSLNLTQKDVYPATGLVRKASSMNAIEEMFQLSKAMTLIALFATVPGYWFTVYFIDKIGRFYIQLGGFLAMSICMAFLGVNYGKLRGNKGSCDYDYCGGNHKLFIFLFGLCLFFANFGPNSTTFIVPAELFPARLRSTCHGISAAAGKAGAIIAAYVFQKKTQHMEAERLKSVLIQLSIVNMLGFCFSFLVPETRGKSLEELSGEDRDIGATDSNLNNNGEREHSRVTDYELSQSQSQSQSQSGVRDV